MSSNDLVLHTLPVRSLLQSWEIQSKSTVRGQSVKKFFPMAAQSIPQTHPFGDSILLAEKEQSYSVAIKVPASRKDDYIVEGGADRAVSRGVGRCRSQED